MPSSRPIDRFNDIIDNIDAIAAYTAGMDETQFLADRKTYDASERCLARISEAAVKLGLLAEQLAPDQPWAQIRSLGNRLRHEYPDINQESIWKTVSEDLPSLKRDCQAAVRQLGRQ